MMALVEQEVVVSPVLFVMVTKTKIAWNAKEKVNSMNERKRDLKFMEIPPGTAPDLMVHTLELDDDNFSELLELYQTKVGGLIQLVPLTENCGLYINEDGKLKKLGLNKVATCLAERHIPNFSKHDYIVGTAVLVGLGDKDEEISAPADMMYDALRVCRMIREIIDAGKISGIGSDKWQDSMMSLVEEISTTGTKPPSFEGSFEWN